jgi:lipoprotein signal peptidase
VGFDPGPRFWAFNVADSSIVVGILLVIVTLWWEERSQAHPTTSS